MDCQRLCRGEVSSRRTVTGPLVGSIRPVRRIARFGWACSTRAGRSPSNSGTRPDDPIHLVQVWFFERAALRRKRAAGMETTASRRVVELSGRPSNGVRGRPRREGDGTADSSARVYGCLGSAITDPTGPSRRSFQVHDGDALCHRPHHAEVVSDEDHGQMVLAHDSIEHERIWAWTETSSEDVGSSATRTLGPAARARAMATRWRCPPLSWCG